MIYSLLRNLPPGEHHLIHLYKESTYTPASWGTSSCILISSHLPHLPPGEHNPVHWYAVSLQTYLLGNIILYTFIVILHTCLLGNIILYTYIESPFTHASWETSSYILKYSQSTHLLPWKYHPAHWLKVTLNTCLLGNIILHTDIKSFIKPTAWGISSSTLL